MPEPWRRYRRGGPERQGGCRRLDRCALADIGIARAALAGSLARRFGLLQGRFAPLVGNALQGAQHLRHQAIDPQIVLTRIRMLQKRCRRLNTLDNRLLSRLALMPAARQRSGGGPPPGARAHLYRRLGPRRGPYPYSCHGYKGEKMDFKGRRRIFFMARWVRKRRQGKRVSDSPRRNIGAKADIHKPTGMGKMRHDLRFALHQIVSPVPSVASTWPAA